LTFWLRHSFVIPHSDFVINNSGEPTNWGEALDDLELPTQYG